MSTLIEMRQVTKSYVSGSYMIHALRAINLTIMAGEFVAIMGPSGSGKSTLMNIVGCLDKPTQGVYWFHGSDTSRLGDNELSQFRNRHIGFVFQQFNLVPRLTALKQVMLPLAYAGLGGGAVRVRAEQALQAVGLGDRLHHKPDELSGGQQQRVAIARALVNEPELILADEPTGALDTQTGQDILATLHHFHRNRGVTIIIVTHDLGIASEAGRIISIRDGRIVADN